MYSTYILTKGSRMEKLKFAFAMIDEEGDGVITRFEMQQIVAALYKVMHVLGLGTFITKTPVEYVNEIFAKFDDDETGTITFDKFQKGVISHPNLLRGYV